MSKAKKTFKVEDLKSKINNMILNTKDSMKEERSAIAIVLESVLMDTDNYNGLNYLTKEQMLKSQDGMSWGIGDFNEATSSHDWSNTDHTRVCYL